MKKKKPIDWKARAKTLGKYGYEFPKRIGPKTKTKIATAWNKHGNWLNSTTPERIQFIKGEPKKGITFDTQTTPTGFFVKRPKNVSKSEYKVIVKKGGEVEFRIKSRSEIVVSLRKRGLVEDPEKEIRRAIGTRRPVKVKMFIEGFDGHEIFSPKELSYYMVNLWLPEREESEEGIPNIKLKLIYDVKPKARAKRKVATKARKTVRRHRH